MKAIVIYKSKTGFVKKYAQWIAEELSADISEASKVTIDTLTPYDTVIYGGGLYASGINGVKLITQNLNKLKGKIIVVFASGASPSRVDAISEVKNNNFTAEQQKQIEFFYLRGGFDYNRLNTFYKMIMLLLKWKLKTRTKAGLTPDESGMLTAFDKPVDFTSKENIYEIISYVTSK